MTGNTNSRIYTLFFATAVLLTGVFFRLIYLQVFQHEYYQALAEGQQWHTFEISAPRGQILSADQYPLATNQDAYLLYAEPQNIDDIDAVVEQLLPLVKDELVASPPALEDPDFYNEVKQTFTDRIKSDLRWVGLVHRVSSDTKATIEGLQIKGLGFEEEPRRFYPEGTLASHVLGFVGSDELGHESGYWGLEGYYDGDLQGRPGVIRQEKNSSGEPLIFGDSQKIEPLEGRDLVLTINHAWQYLVEESLRKAVISSGASSGTVIVQNPKTGGILAMASFPTFDPGSWRETSGENEYRSEDPLIPEVDRLIQTRNLATAYTYEPGSVIKALTMSSGIEEGLITPQTTYECTGPLYVGGYTIDTWNHEYHGTESMTEVLIHSCNIGAAFVSRLLGPEKMIPYFEGFNFSRPLGIDLEGEESGVIKPVEEWGDVELATAAFGQGLSATPLQVIEIFSTIANDGVLMKPYVVDTIIDKNRIIKTRPQKIHRVISEKTSESLVEMLSAVISQSASPFYTLRDRYIVAGKTGTAEIPVDGSYDANQTNVTFVAFLPRSRDFVMLVKLERPTTSPYAEVVAVPLWMDIAEDLVLQMGVHPDK